jgi:hypothetical protein
MNTKLGDWKNVGIEMSCILNSYSNQNQRKTLKLSFGCHAVIVETKR